MADRVHLEMLKKGVSGWNRWRREERVYGLDLAGADLAGADLDYADLAGVDLRGADLESAHTLGTNFTEAKLEGCRLPSNLTGCQFFLTDLRGRDFWGHGLDGTRFGEADLRGVDLGEADLTGASIGDADLRGANLDDSGLVAADVGSADLRDATLRECDLCMAVLTGTKLAGADLAKARFDRTVLADVDLSGAKNLHLARHEGPSTLGADTIERTLAGAAGDAGRLQEVIFFFRGAGVPEHLIEHYRRADTSPRYRPALMLHDREDEGFCRTLHEELLARGARCWRFPKMSRAQGTPTLRRKWHARERVIFCASRAALASEWAPGEVAAGVWRMQREGLGDPMIFVDLDGCLRDGAPGPGRGEIRGLVAADLSRVVSGEGELEEAVERVLERLRSG